MHLTSHSLFLGARPSWPCFSPGCCFSFSLQTLPLLNLYRLWYPGDQGWTFFASCNLSWRGFSYSMISPTESQQRSHICISFGLWTYLILPFGFLTGMSYVTHPKLDSEPLPLYILVNSTTIYLAAQTQKMNHFICKTSAGQFH